jgi:uncharacterized protein YbjT (DUF2867 family)
VKVLVLGATGPTGRAVVVQALRRGMQVRAVVRRAGSAPEGADEVVGDARSAQVVDRGMQGVDAVICLISSRPGEAVDTCSQATATLIAAARAHGVSRLIVQTGAMIGHPRERLSWVYRTILRMMPREQLALVADRRTQEQIVQASGLDWTLVRPPRLVVGRPTGRVESGAELFVSALARLDRADLAKFLLDAVDDARLFRKCVTVINQ